MKSFEDEMMNDITIFWNMRGYVVVDSDSEFVGLPEILSPKEAIDSYWKEMLPC